MNTEVLNIFVKSLDDKSEFIREHALIILKGYDKEKEVELNNKYIQLAKSAMLKAKYDAKPNAPALSKGTWDFKFS